MRFHWIKDRVKQKHFEVIWEPGSTNLADFFTKAHSATHHNAARHFYVRDKHVSCQDSSQEKLVERVY